jgi:hypothetical protein
MIFAAELPDSPPWVLPQVREDRDVIPGNTTDAQTARKFPYTFYRDISAEEIEEARRKPYEGPYKASALKSRARLDKDTSGSVAPGRPPKRVGPIADNLARR